MDETTQLPQPEPSVTDPRQVLKQQEAALMVRIVSSGKWFHWIAALSVINALIAVFNGKWNFVVGLGITQVITAIATELSHGIVAKIIAMFFVLSIAAIFLLFGYYAVRAQAWAFITGIVLYGLDALLCLAFQDWLSFAFHLYVLYLLITGLRTLKPLNEVQVQLQVENWMNPK